MQHQWQWAVSENEAWLTLLPRALRNSSTHRKKTGSEQGFWFLFWRHVWFKQLDRCVERPPSCLTDKIRLSQQLSQSFILRLRKSDRAQYGCGQRNRAVINATPPSSNAAVAVRRMFYCRQRVMGAQRRPVTRGRQEALFFLIYRRRWVTAGPTSHSAAVEATKRGLSPPPARDILSFNKRNHHLKPRMDADPPTRTLNHISLYNSLITIL